MITLVTGVLMMGRLGNLAKQNKSIITDVQQTILLFSEGHIALGLVRTQY